MAHYQGRTSVCSLSTADIADRRYTFPGNREAPSPEVLCDVAHTQPEVWCQCVGTSEGPGASIRTTAGKDTIWGGVVQSRTSPRRNARRPPNICAGDTMVVGDAPRRGKCAASGLLPRRIPFRFNRRTYRSRGLLFYRLLEISVQTDPTSFGNMIGGKPILPQA